MVAADPTYTCEALYPTLGSLPVRSTLSARRALPAACCFERDVVPLAPLLAALERSCAASETRYLKRPFWLEPLALYTPRKL